MLTAAKMNKDRLTRKYPKITRHFDPTAANAKRTGELPYLVPPEEEENEIKTRNKAKSPTRKRPITRKSPNRETINFTKKAIETFNETKKVSSLEKRIKTNIRNIKNRGKLRLSFRDNNSTESSSSSAGKTYIEQLKEEIQSGKRKNAQTDKSLEKIRDIRREICEFRKNLNDTASHAIWRLNAKEWFESGLETIGEIRLEDKPSDGGLSVAPTLKSETDPYDDSLNSSEGKKDHAVAEVEEEKNASVQAGKSTPLSSETSSSHETASSSDECSSGVPRQRQPVAHEELKIINQNINVDVNKNEDISNNNEADKIELIQTNNDFEKYPEEAASLQFFVNEDLTNRSPNVTSLLPPVLEDVTEVSEDTELEREVEKLINPKCS